MRHWKSKTRLRREAKSAARAELAKLAMQSMAADFQNIERAFGYGEHASEYAAAIISSRSYNIADAMLRDMEAKQCSSTI